MANDKCIFILILTVSQLVNCWISELNRTESSPGGSNLAPLKWANISKTVFDDRDLSQVNIRKCCPYGDLASVSGTCVTDGANATSDGFAVWNRQNNISEIVDYTDFHVDFGLDCPDEYYHTVYFSNFEPFLIYEDGTLFLPDRNRTVGQGEFCIDKSDLDQELRLDETVWSVKFCQESPCRRSRDCIRKCCSVGYGVDQSTGLCVPYRKPLRIPFENAVNDSDVDLSVIREQNIITHCNADEVEFQSFWNGTGFLNGTNPLDSIHFIYPPGIIRSASHPHLRSWDYCIDYFLQANRSNEDLQPLKAYVCSSQNDNQLLRVISWYFLHCCLDISVIVLLIIFFIYLLLPKQRSLNKLIILHYIGALFLSFFLEALAIWMDVPKASYSFCLFHGISFHICELASYTWLNVMSFDIWLAFRKMKPLNKGEAGKIARRVRFLLYCLYGWGIPCLIAAFGQILDHVPNLPEHWIKPGLNIQENRCRFSSKTRSNVYWLHIPIAIVVLTNVVFFALTAWNLNRAHRDTALVTDEKTKKQRYRVAMYLFLITGVDAGLSYAVLFANSPVTWFLSNIIDLTSSLLHFYFLVCKKHIYDYFSRIYQLRRKEAASIARQWRSFIWNGFRFLHLPDRRSKEYSFDRDNGQSGIDIQADQPSSSQSNSVSLTSATRTTSTYVRNAEEEKAV